MNAISKTSRVGRARLWGLGLAVATVVALTQHAAANSLTLNFDGMYFGTSSLTARTSITGQLTVYAGVMKWKEQGNASNQFQTVCTEVTQAMVQTSVFETNHLHVAPVPGQGMGEYRAGMIQDLYNKYWNNATASRTESAAFQLAVWEIAYEDNIVAQGGDPLTLLGGVMTITGGSATQVKDGFGMSALQLANQWLSTLVSVDVTNLIALTSPDAQDQIIVIPLPPAVAMASLGLLVGVFARRRLVATI